MPTKQSDFSKSPWILYTLDHPEDGQEVMAWSPLTNRQEHCTYEASRPSGNHFRIYGETHFACVGVTHWHPVHVPPTKQRR